jgi:hypothetical protein
MKAPLTLLFLSVLLCIVHAQTPQSPPPVAVPTGPRPDERNLFTNGDFSKGTAGWHLANWGKDSKMAIDPLELYDGRPTLRVYNLEPCHSFVRQFVQGKPFTRYRLTAYVKTLNVEREKPEDDTGAGLEVGRLGVYTAPILEKTNRWTKVSVEFATKDDGEIRVGPTLGTDPSFVTGTAWFADLELVELGGVEDK